MASLHQLSRPMPRQDIPQTDDSLRRAKVAREAELDLARECGVDVGADGRARLLPTYNREREAEQMARVEAIERLTVMVHTYGAHRVQVWLGNIAKIQGQAL
jgi:hypothetical protein